VAIERLTNEVGKYAFDELVAREAFVHVERMSNEHVWMEVQSAGRRIVLNFHSGRGISVAVTDETAPETETKACAAGATTHNTTIEMSGRCPSCGKTADR